MSKGLRLVALLLLLGGLVLREPLLGGAAFILGGATFFTGWWTTYAERSLRIQRQAPETISFGDRASVMIEVANRSLLPIPWLQITDSVPLAIRTGTPLKLAFALNAGGARRLSYDVVGTRRGYYMLGPLRLYTGDVLGLHTRQLSAPPVALTVFPRVLPVARVLLPAQLPFGPLSAITRRGEDPARPAGVRPYQASDGVRRLDWKSTARHGELLVRRAEPSVAPETTFALAFGRGDYPGRILQDCLERGATAAASLGVALLDRKLPVGLISNGIDAKHPAAPVVLPQGKGDGQRQLLLYLLGRLQPSEGASLWEMLARQALPWGGTIGLIIADLQPELLPAVHALKRRGQYVMLLPLEGSAEGRALARQHGLRVLQIDRDGVPVFET